MYLHRNLGKKVCSAGVAKKGTELAMTVKKVFTVYNVDIIIIII